METEVECQEEERAIEISDESERLRETGVEYEQEEGAIEISNEMETEEEEEEERDIEISDESERLRETGFEYEQEEEEGAIEISNEMETEEEEEERDIEISDENERSMDTEVEYDEQEQEEEEEEDVESEDEEEKDEEEEIEELKEMTSPRISCWLGADGKTYKGVMVVDYDISCQGNKCQYDDCSICFQPIAIRGKHRLCCLPCGHLYGFSCIKKWLGQSPFSGKCPQCNFVCAYKDVVPLLASALCVRAQEKATSTRYFPFTEQGFIEFKEHESSRRLDAQRKYTDDYERRLDVAEQQRDLVKQQAALRPQWDDLAAWRVELDQQAAKLGQPVVELEGFDAFKRQRRALTLEHEDFQRRFDALGRLGDALKRRNNVMAQRYHAYEPSLKFFDALYKEHLATQKNSEPCTALTS